MQSKHNVYKGHFFVKIKKVHNNKKEASGFNTRANLVKTDNKGKESIRVKLITDQDLVL